MSWLERLNIDVRMGDLLAQATDAVVCTVNVELGPYGALSKQLFQSGSTAFLARIAELKRGLPQGRINLGQAVALMHDSPEGSGATPILILAALWERENEYTNNLMYRFFSNSLREAFGVNVVSLAFPILKVDREKYAGNVCQVLRQFDGLKTADSFPVEQLLFVSTSEQDVTYLREYLRERHFID